MADLSFSVRGYFYQKSLDDMRSAFQATMRALHAEHENVLAELSAIRARVQAGEPAYERDEEGFVLYSFEDAQLMRTEQSDFALRSARNAFAVMLHHLWEKAVDEWREARLSDDNYNPKKAYQWLEQNGFLINQAALEFIRMTANAIKHNNRDLYDNFAHKDIFRISKGQSRERISPLLWPFRTTTLRR